MSDQRSPVRTMLSGFTPLALAAYGLALAVIVVDQIAKGWVLGAFVRQCPELKGHLSLAGITMCQIPVWPGAFNLTLVWNGGMSFGLFRGGADFSRWALTVFAVGVAGALAYWARHTDKRLFALAAGCLIGGALGNVIDRFRFGSVVDFLDFNGLMGGHFPWIFNVADSAITVGAIALLVEAFGPPLQSWLASRSKSGN
ncbi:MAG TPA: signal peptidase II [Caulobacteraceae bacterium]|jgi:signal peptidase II|nr:signal peptidase II [Caulobacteraceae bacterium]